MDMASFHSPGVHPSSNDEDASPLSGREGKSMQLDSMPDCRAGELSPQQSAETELPQRENGSRRP
jgi:hypothetical protein